MNPVRCVLLLASIAIPRAGSPAILQLEAPAQLTLGGAPADGPVVLLNDTNRELEIDLSVQALPSTAAPGTVLVDPSHVRLAPAAHARVSLRAPALAPGTYDLFLTAIERRDGAVVHRPIRVVVPAAPKPSGGGFALANAERWELLAEEWPWREPEIVLPLSAVPSPLPEGKKLSDALAVLRVDLAAKSGYRAALIPMEPVIVGTISGGPNPDAVRFRVAGLGPPAVYEGKLGDVRFAVTFSHPLPVAVVVLLLGILVSLLVHRFAGVTSRVWSIEERIATLRARWAAVEKQVAKRVPAMKRFGLEPPLPKALDAIEQEAHALASSSLDALDTSALVGRLGKLDEIVTAWPHVGEAVETLEQVLVAAEDAVASAPPTAKLPRDETAPARARARTARVAVAHDKLADAIADVANATRDLQERLRWDAIARRCREALASGAAPGDVDPKVLESAWYQLWTASDLPKGSFEAIAKLREKLHLAEAHGKAIAGEGARGEAAAAVGEPRKRIEAPAVRRRRAMWTALAVLPLTVAFGIVAVVKQLYFGHAWGTPLDYVETFAIGFATQSTLTLANTLLAQALAARTLVRSKV